MPIVGEGLTRAALPPTRQLRLGLDSRYSETRLFQIADDSRRVGTTQGRRRVDQNRDLPRSLHNQVRKLDNVFVWGVWSPIDIPEASDDTIFRTTEQHKGRLDNLAAEFYDNPNLWWVLAHVNNIQDPLADIVPGTQLRIPSYSNVTSRLLASTTQHVEPVIEGVAT